MNMFKSFSRIISLVIAFVMVVGMVQISMPLKAEAATINSAEDLLLFPAPRNLTAGNGKLALTDGYIESDDSSLKAINKIYQSASDLAGVNLKDNTGSAVVKINKDENLNEQGYSLVIGADGIEITYKDEPGSYYAAATLYQILWQAKNSLPYLTIENDYPDFKYRAFDMDISRNRIPNLETLKSVVDMLDALKYNQFFLYLEGYPYAYESYPDAWENAKPLTPQEIRELSNYCKARGIELIPAQNSLGHSAKVVSTYPELADVPNGQVLNVFDPKTQTYLSNIFDDLYDGFDTEYLQIGCDETTFNLETGTAAAMWEANNPGKEATKKDVYFDSIKTIYDMAEKKGKKVLYWSDMIIANKTNDFNSCAYAKELMPNAIAMNWSYYVSTDRFDYSSKWLSQAGIPFYVCPGDQSWSTIIGDAPTLLENARNAAVKGKQYGAIGYCMTNWGDGGHYQNLVTSYPGISYASGLSWCYDNNNENNTKYNDYLNMFVYEDETNTLSQMFSEISGYKQDFGISYDLHTPKAMMNDNWNSFGSGSFLWKIMNTSKDTTVDVTERDALIAKCEGLSAEIDEYLAKLESTDIPSDIVALELKNTVETLKLTVDYIAIRSKLMTGGEITEPKATVYELSDDIFALADDFERVTKDFSYIWGNRDLTNNLNATILQFRAISAFFKNVITVRDTYKVEEGDNLFKLTPDNVESISAMATGMPGASTWSYTGSYIPIMTVNKIGGTSIQKLKDATSEALTVTDSIDGSAGRVFVYDTKKVKDGGYFTTEADSSISMPTVGFPAIIPVDGKYTFTVKAKLKSDAAITNDNVYVSGLANKIGAATAVNIANGAEVSVSAKDANGWYTVTAELTAEGVDAASVNLLPKGDDTLYVTDYKLSCKEITKAVISTFHEKNVTSYIGANVTVPKAYTNGKEAISIKLKNPAGTESTVNMGDNLILETAGTYTLTYSASDVTTPLSVTFTAEHPYQSLLNLVEKIEKLDLSIYTDETVNPLKEKIAEAKELIADENATREDFDTCQAELDALRKALTLKRAVVTSDKITVTAHAGVYQNNVLSNAVDGDVNTFAYIADYQTVGDYIQFEFSESVKLDGAQIINNEGNDLLNQGELQVSTNGTEWQTVGAVLNKAYQTVDFTAVDAKYARILCTKDIRYWWKLSEVTFYINVPDAVGSDNYIASGMSIVKAKTEDKYGNAYDSTYPMTNIIDGNTSTMGANAYYYATAGAASRTLTVIDLGKDYELKAVEFASSTATQIDTAFNAVSPVSTYKKLNANGAGVYVSNSIPTYTDFDGFEVSAKATATDLVRLQIGGNFLSSGNWDPEKRGTGTCNKLEEGATYRYISIWSPYGGGHALNEIKVKVTNYTGGGTITPDTSVKISNLSVDASGNVSISVANAPDTATVYIGSFDKDDCLLEVHRVTLINGAATKKFNTTDVKKYKAFVWQDYMPLVDVKDIDA